MSKGVAEMSLDNDAREILKKTSRTFYIPISRLPSQLLEAVASAYLCMRAIDEIEDHPDLDNAFKTKLLRQIALELQKGRENTTLADFSFNLDGLSELPEVSVRIGEWSLIAPQSIAPRIWDATAAMADRMAGWAADNWRIETEQDLDAYTFSVAGAVGLLLSDIWAWYDGTRSDRRLAIGFGRGLQAVNILRNDKDDQKRGISFYPAGWTRAHMFAYARRNLELGDAYTRDLQEGPAMDFCRIPLTLAKASLDVMALGRKKLSRSEVESLLG